MRGRILIVDKKVPTPDRDSGSASTFSYLQILSRAGYEIVFVPDTPTERDGYSRALDALGIKTLLAPEWTSTLAGVEAFAPRCDLILLYRAPVAAKVFEVARRAAPPSVKILFHAVDLHFLRLLRQAEASGRRTELDVAMMTREIELNLVNTCDATIVVRTRAVRVGAPYSHLARYSAARMGGGFRAQRAQSPLPPGWSRPVAAPA